VKPIENEVEDDMYGSSHMNELERKMSVSSRSSFGGSKSTSDWNQKKYTEPKNIVFKEIAS